MSAAGSPSARFALNQAASEMSAVGTSEVMIAVNRLHWPVTVLGPGRRVGIWMQGCSIGCPGCVSRDTWPALGEGAAGEGSPGDIISVGDLMARIDALVDGASLDRSDVSSDVEARGTAGRAVSGATRWAGPPSLELAGAAWPDAASSFGAGVGPDSAGAGAVGRDGVAVDGVTVSGGEPLDQPEALEALLDVLRQWLDGRADPGAEIDTDIIVYTGYDEAAARDRCPAAFSLADAVIVGPYQAGEPGTAWWGSGNQRLIARNEQLARRYHQALGQAGGEVQVSVADEGVFIIGIPRPRTLARVESKLAAAGIRLEGVSWRP